MLILPGGEAWDAGENPEILEFSQSTPRRHSDCSHLWRTAGLTRRNFDDKPHTSKAYLQATHYRGVQHSI